MDRFRVPRLIDSDDALLVIEMDVIKPPRILDFGKAYVKLHPMDRPHPYTDEEIERSLAESKEKYWEDHQWPVVLNLIHLLDDHGICYFDVSPGNIDLGE